MDGLSLVQGVVICKPQQKSSQKELNSVPDEPVFERPHSTFLDPTRTHWICLVCGECLLRFEVQPTIDTLLLTLVY